MLTAGHTPETVMAGAFGLGAVLLAPVLAVKGAGLAAPDGAALILFLGVVPTALAYLLFARGLKRLSAAETATLTLAEPLTATLLGVVVLSEHLNAPAAFGGALILAGLLVLAAPEIAPSRYGPGVTTVETITNALRREILDGERVGGQRLVEQELTARYGVARHTLRAALRELAAEGLVRIEPNRGARVARLGAEDIIQLYELRTALEVEAARLALERHRGRLPTAVHDGAVNPAGRVRASYVGADQPRRTRTCTRRSSRPPRVRGSSRPTPRSTVRCSSSSPSSNRSGASSGWQPTTPRSCGGWSATGQLCCGSTSRSPRQLSWPPKRPSGRRVVSATHLPGERRGSRRPIGDMLSAY